MTTSTDTRHSNGAPSHRDLEEILVAQDTEAWRAKTRIFLTPIAAPSIMGLFGFMIATLMLGAWQAGWYGSSTTPTIIWPLAMFAGGVLQSVAAAYSLRARDGVATAVHTAWGSFWLGWGVLQILAVTGTVPAIHLGATDANFAIWFVGLTMVTATGFIASMAQSATIALTTGTLAAGAALTAAGFFSGSLGIQEAGGWLFVASAAAAWFAATAMVLEHATGRTIIPLGKWSKSANIPGGKGTVPMQYEHGMPGVRVGQ